MTDIQNIHNLLAYYKNISTVHTNYLTSSHTVKYVCKGCLQNTVCVPVVCWAKFTILFS